jgi:hypothetical protein
MKKNYILLKKLYFNWKNFYFMIKNYILLKKLYFIKKTVF